LKRGSVLLIGDRAEREAGDSAARARAAHAPRPHRAAQNGREIQGKSGAHRWTCADQEEDARSQRHGVWARQRAGWRCNPTGAASAPRARLARRKAPIAANSGNTPGAPGASSAVPPQDCHRPRRCAQPGAPRTRCTQRADMARRSQAEPLTGRSTPSSRTPGRRSRAWAARPTGP